MSPRTRRAYEEEIEELERLARGPFTGYARRALDALVPHGPPGRSREEDFREYLAGRVQEIRDRLDGWRPTVPVSLGGPGCRPRS